MEKLERVVTGCGAVPLMPQLSMEGGLEVFQVAGVSSGGLCHYPASG